MSNRVIFPKSRGTRELHKRVPTGTGETSTGFALVADGHEEYYYEVSIDIDQLEAMAAVATRSKGQRSKDGALLVRITARRRID